MQGVSDLLCPPTKFAAVFIPSTISLLAGEPVTIIDWSGIVDILLIPPEPLFDAKCLKITANRAEIAAASWNVMCFGK